MNQRHPVEDFYPLAEGPWNGWLARCADPDDPPIRLHIRPTAGDWCEVYQRFSLGTGPGIRMTMYVWERRGPGACEAPAACRIPAHTLIDPQATFEPDEVPHGCG